jgi:hypothetical protein
MRENHDVDLVGLILFLPSIPMEESATAASSFLRRRGAGESDYFA